MRQPTQPTVYRRCEPVAGAVDEQESDESIVKTLVDALAEIKSVDTKALSPIYEDIDLDAVRQLFEKQDGESETVLGFTVDEWNVFLGSEGQILVCDGNHRTEPEPVFETGLV